jgi:hypothetical protein
MCSLLPPRANYRLCIAPLQRIGSLSPPFSAMPCTRDDSCPHVLRRIAPCSCAGRQPTNRRKSDRSIFCSLTIPADHPTQDVSQTAASHLLYTRFSTVARTVRPLLHALEDRTKENSDALSGVLDDCTNAYFAARRQLLLPRVGEEIRGFDMQKAELVGLVSSYDL